MRKLTRYVVSEFLKAFIGALIVISSLMVVGLVLALAIQEGCLAPMSILRLLPYAVPMALLYAIPVATLFAVCSIYGRMSAGNEVTAVKAAGASPMSLLWPTLVVSFLLSILVVWLNDVAVSWGRLGAKRVVLDSVEQIVYGLLRSQKSYSTPRFSISVRGIDGQRLLKPTVTLRLDDNRPPTNIMAEEAELSCDAANETLTIILRDSEITAGKYHAYLPGERTRVIPLVDATRRGNDSGRPANTKLGRIAHEIQEQAQQVEQSKREFAAEAAVQMLTGDLDALTDEEWNSRHAEILNGTSRLHRLKTEPWRRFANGFSCFFFALFGAPLAVRLRKEEVWTSFGICFVLILPIYYPLMMYGVDLAKAGTMPPFCVWMGNAVLGLVGYSFIRKMLRY